MFRGDYAAGEKQILRLRRTKLKNEPVFLKCDKEAVASKAGTPEFYRLYRHAVLLALKEDGILSDAEYRYCCADDRYKSSGG